MSETIQTNLRLAPEHADLMRRIARRFRDDPTLAGRLAEVLNGPPAQTALDDVLSRLDAVEARLAVLESVPTAQDQSDSEESSATDRTDSEDSSATDPHADIRQTVTDRMARDRLTERAAASGIGIGRSTLKDFLAGKSPGAATLAKVADWLGR